MPRCSRSLRSQQHRERPYKESGDSVAFFWQALQTNCIDAWLWRICGRVNKGERSRCVHCPVMYVLSVQKCLDERQKQAHEGERCESKQQLEPKR